MNWRNAVEALAILLFLVVCGTILVVPIVALVKAAGARRQVRQLQDEVAQALLQLEVLQQQTRGIAERLVRLEAVRSERATEPHGLGRQQPEDASSVSALKSTEPIAFATDPEKPTVPNVPVRARVGETLADVPELLSEPIQESALAATPVDPQPEGATPAGPVPEADAVAETTATTPEDPSLRDTREQASPSVATEPLSNTERVNQPPAQFDLEGLIGVRLFAWLGGGALFLAAALFLHYSIQQNLISPPVRVALGLLSGALLMAAGDRLRVKANMAGQAMAGAGVGTLYAALFAARALYDLLPVSAAFGGMVLVTLAAGALAVKRGAYLIAVLSLIGGVATPFLLSTGKDQPWSLFAYVLLLDVGIAWVSKKREWPTLALLGLCASILVFIAWATQYLYPHRTPYALAALALVAGLFLSLLWRWRPDAKTEVSGTLRAMAHLAMLAPLLAASVLTHLPRLLVSPTFLTVYLMILALGGALVARRTEAKHMPALVAACAVIAQLGCVSSEFFGTHAVSTLASFSMLPAAHVLIWWYHSQSEWRKAHFWAAALTLISPILLATNGVLSQVSDAPTWPFGVYTALHVLALLFIAHVEVQPIAYVVAQGVALVVLGVVGSHAGARTLGSWSIWLAGSGLVFWYLPLTSAHLRQGRLALVVSASSLPLHFLLLYSRANHHWKSGPLGALCVLGGILMLFGIARLRQLLDARAERLVMLALHGALCLAFLTAALPILLENQWLTVALGLEVAALAWLHRRVPHTGLLDALAGVAAVALIRLLLNPSLWDYAPRSSLPILNFYLYTFGIVAVSFLVAAHWLANFTTGTRSYLPAFLKWASVVLLFVLVNIEVADYYSVGATLEFRLMGGGLAQDMTYSLAWGLFALTLIGLGILRRNRATRMGALLILILTIAKVFLHDLWQLGALYRVGSIVGLAVALLVVSYLVQRFILRGENS